MSADDKPERPEETAAPSRCEHCGRRAPTAPVSFHQHIGLLILGDHRLAAGHFCRICVDRTFRRTTLVTALLGWWGVLSALVTLVVLPLNVARYLRARSLPPPDPSAQPDPAAVRSRSLRFGTAPLVVAVWSVLHLALVGAAAGAYLTLGPTPFGMPYWAAPVGLLAPDALLTAIYAVLGMRAGTRVAGGTKGRTRILVLSWSALLRAVGTAVLAAVLAIAFTDPGTVTFGLGADELLPLGPSGLWQAIDMVTATQGTRLVLWAAIVLTAASMLVELGAAVTAWFLTPRELRRVLWLVVDGALLVGFVAVTLLLPIQPPATAPDAWQLPTVRLAVTTLAATRFLARFLPILLDGIERVGFQLLVAARLLRAPKSGFLTAIGALSILAVAFSTCTLTTTLSVMGGFRNDLKRKILGNNAHVVIDREHGTFEGWQPMLGTIREQPHVIGASPYVQGEVMITSATNLSGAILRGIDPASIGRVTELPRNMRHGRLEYLSHPERLLELRREELDRDLLAPPIRSRAGARRARAAAGGSRPSRLPRRRAGRAPGRGPRGSRHRAHPRRPGGVPTRHPLTERSAGAGAPAGAGGRSGARAHAAPARGRSRRRRLALGRPRPGRPHAQERDPSASPASSTAGCTSST